MNSTIEEPETFYTVLECYDFETLDEFLHRHKSNPKCLIIDKYISYLKADIPDDGYLYERYLYGFDDERYRLQLHGRYFVAMNTLEGGYKRVSGIKQNPKPYEEGTNYKFIHLKWITENPDFRPRGKIDTGLQGHKSYYDNMQEVYTSTSNRFAYACWEADCRFLESGKNKEMTALANETFGLVPHVNEDNKYFVTFNFDPAKFKVNKALQYAKAFFKLTWIVSGRGVFEYHGKDSNHPHFMCVITISDKYRKLGQTKNKLKGVSLYTQFISGENFLDIKKYDASRHQDYIVLDKASKKADHLADDIVWRVENKLPHFIQKVSGNPELELNYEL